MSIANRPIVGRAPPARASLIAMSRAILCGRLALLAVALGASVVAHAQSAVVWGTTTVASGLKNPTAGVAVDASGNVYIADSGNNRVLKETVAAGSYTPSTVVICRN